MSQNLMIGKFFATAVERYHIKLRKDMGHAPFWSVKRVGEDMVPAWTADLIFQNYRFCNVFREDDKVTAWFRKNIREKMLGPVQNVRAAVAFRWFNLPATGELLIPWLEGAEGMNAAHARVAARYDNRLPILNGAYMIKSPPGMNKHEGIFQCIGNVEKALGMLAYDIEADNSLQRTVERLCEFPYLGPFMAYQSACDLRFTPLLDRASDISTWTAPGPGSARGISRIFHGCPDIFNYNSPKDKGELIEHMKELLRYADPSFNHWPVGWPKWELSTVQHWACEFDKYCRALNGEGEPKQRYRFRDTIAG